MVRDSMAPSNSALMDIGPAEIADRLLADVAHAHAGDNRQRKAAIDQRPTEFAFARIGRIEMQRMLVHSEQREPGIVRFADGASRPVLVDVAGGEILEIAAVALAIAVRADFGCNGDHRTSLIFNLSGQPSAR
jgi:hypothetical protein